MPEETKTIDEKKLPVASVWKAYREMCIHRNATENQIEQLQEAFYSGAQALFATIMIGLSPGPQAKPIDETFLSAIENELMNYALARVHEGMKARGNPS